MTSDWDDSGQLPWLESQRCAFVRGRGRVVRAGVVEVEGEEIEYDRLVVATGSSPAVPPVAGLDEVEYWTNQDATRTHEVPASLAVMGGGPVGAELAQFFARMGSKVTVIEHGPRLLGRVHEEAGELLADVFRSEGIDAAPRRRRRGGRAGRRAPPLGRLDGRGRAAARRDRPPPEHGGSRPRAARRRRSARAGSRSTSGCAPRRTSGRSATSPASPCSPMSASTRPGSPRRTSRGGRRGPTTGRSRRGSSPTRRWRPSGARTATASSRRAGS